MRMYSGSRLLPRLGVTLCLGLSGFAALAQQPALAAQAPLSGAAWTVAMASPSGSAGVPVATPTGTVLALGTTPNDNVAADLFVQNLSPTGTTLWSLPAGLPNNPPSAVAVGDASGNTYLQVQSYATGSTFEARDASGRLLWGPISSGGYYPWGGLQPVVGFNDSVYFAESNGTGTTVIGVNRNTGATTLKMDFSDVLGLYAYAGGLAVDDFHSHVLYIGYDGVILHDYPTTVAALTLVSTAGGADGAIFLSGHPGDCSTPINVEKITPAGKSWMKSVAPAGTCTNSLLAATPDGGVVLAAPDSSSPSSSDVVSLDPSGAVRWRHRFEPTGNPFSQVSLPFVDSKGTVVVPSLFSHPCGTQSCAGLHVEFLNQATGGSAATPIEISDAATDFFSNGLAIGPGLVYVVRALQPSISALSAPILTEDYRIAITRPATPPPPPNPLSLSATPSSQTVGYHVVLLATGAGAPGTLVTFGVTAGPDVSFAAIIAADSTGAAGTALLGKGAGTDTVVAWIDANKNGKADLGESAGTTSVTWSIPPLAPYKYVALGDSFSSGEGIEPFIDGSRQLCHRSELAYSSFVELPSRPGTTVRSAAISQPIIQWGFQACSGAVAKDVTTNRRYGNLAQLTLSPQTDRSNSKFLPVSDNTNLVTITVGGNDMEFPDVLQFCAFSNDCAADKYKGETRLDKYLARLEASLGSKLSAVYSKIHDHAPNARILVLGYPQLVPATDTEQSCSKLLQINQFTTAGRRVIQTSVGFSHTEQNFLRQKVSEVNSIIKKTVEETGFATFVPVDAYFSGHEICGNAGEWINAATLSRKLAPNDQSFHPNADGQKLGYAKSVNDVLLGR
jgi:lysophospholipase L1-like esterase